MSIRSIIGIVFYTLGLIVLIYAGWNFYNLLFIQRLITQTDIPNYSRTVFIPILVGVLLLLDGSFVAYLNRMSSAVLYLLGNLTWLYGLNLLYQKLSVPVTEIDSYRNIFYLISAGVLLFIIGAIVNSVQKGPKKLSNPQQR